jgi:site-specific DNA recombinase
MSKAKPRLIPAVGYLRKSTKEDGYEKSTADQKARISKMKPKEDGAEYDILRWYVDPGIQGWRPTHKRPDYFRMVNDLRDRKDFVAILVDDSDRFSRRDEMETVADVQALRELGLRYLHAANQGLKDLEGNITVVAMQIAMEANAAHAHSTGKSRRNTETRVKQATIGKRTGGGIPFGMKADGFEERKGGRRVSTTLAPGDAKQVKVIRWIFEQFAVELQSLRWIAGDLNTRQKVPSPTGGEWYAPTVGYLLRQPAYRGDFQYGRARAGEFFSHNAEGDVLPKKEIEGPGMVFEKRGVYKPIIDPALFEKAQRRLETLAKFRNRRKSAGYALTGVLKCGHCGGPMTGVRPHGPGTPLYYRCQTSANKGVGFCKQYQIAEARVLPFIMEMLGEEIADIRTMLSFPPERLRPSRNKRTEKREQARAERDKLAAQVAKVRQRMLSPDLDDETFKYLTRQAKEMQDGLNRLDADLTIEPRGDVQAQENMRALADWWDAFIAKAVKVPVDYLGKHKLTPMIAMSYQDPLSEGPVLLIEPRKVNDALLQIGCKVEFWWETKQSKTAEGTGNTAKHLPRHTLVRGRFRLGQRQGEIPYVSATMGCRSPRTSRLGPRN